MNAAKFNNLVDRIVGIGEELQVLRMAAAVPKTKAANPIQLLEGAPTEMADLPLYFGRLTREQLDKSWLQVIVSIAYQSEYTPGDLHRALLAVKQHPNGPVVDVEGAARTHQRTKARKISTPKAVPELVTVKNDSFLAFSRVHEPARLATQAAAMKSADPASNHSTSLSAATDGRRQGRLVVAKGSKRVTVLDAMLSAAPDAGDQIVLVDSFVDKNDRAAGMRFGGESDLFTLDRKTVAGKRAKVWVATRTSLAVNDSILVRWRKGEA